MDEYNFKTFSDLIYESRSNIQETAKIVKQLLEKFYRIAFGQEVEFTISEEVAGEEYLVQSDKVYADILIRKEREKDSEDDVILFYPEGIAYDPGVWRYADGSGEPPSYEPFDLKLDNNKSLKDAVIVVIKHLKDIEYKNSLQIFCEFIDLEPAE